jgi:glycosyltransferase Alg8
LVNDKRDDSSAINTLIQKCDGIKPCKIILPEGRIDLNHSIIIDKNHVSIEGTDKDKTIIISHLKTKDIAAIYIKGSRGKKIGFVKENTKLSKVIIEAKIKNRQNYKYIMLRTPNTESFFNKIGSQVWRKKYPYLREQIFQLYSYNPRTELLTLSHKISTVFPKNISEIWGLNLIEDIKLSKFTIAHEIKGKSIQSVQFIYENMYPSDMVDMIRFEYASNVFTENIKILNSGRHPLVMENVLKANHKNLYINGAWNKGKKGSAYVRFARTYNSVLRDSEIKNIRHITLQWSSADNLLENLTLQNVDINFHGGYAHDNLVRNIRSSISSKHLWKEITFTPLNARYAPPDGPRNLVEHIQVNH